MKKSILLVAVIMIAVMTVCGQKSYKYEQVANDPLKGRIYKLDNGLTVFLTVYKDEPRMHTAIAVRSGGKNDPSDNTGLSHYLEHMMFKGTENFGTKDYAKEKIELDKIENLFEVYKQTADTGKRRVLYHQIDSISGVAAKIAIANEYDKMLSFIGAKGTNAFTSDEVTCYINDIPSNQVKTWLDIEFERFSRPVFRIFHTELEAVYEEKNMSLDNDGSKQWEAFTSGLFKKHQYGTQSVLGTIEHLKSPSLTAIKKYFNSRYVPGNMAISISGDFDPDVMIRQIDETFGKMPSKPFTQYVPPVEDPITAPIVKEVIGPDAENVLFGYRLGGRNTADADLLTITDMILANSYAGLIDLNLNQAQKVLEASSQTDIMADYSIHIFSGVPKQGQKLEEVRDLILSQIDLIKKGEFADWLIPAIIKDLKLNQLKSYESNRNRSLAYVNAFTFNIPWSEEVNRIERLSKITKKDIIDFVNKNYNNNYVLVYKKTGTDPNVKKVTKPSITPVEVNRDAQSEFVRNIMSVKPSNIEPLFLNYNEDVKKFNTKKGNIQVLYKKNDENNTFLLSYIFDMGNNNNKKLGLATSYLQYLGTSKYSPMQMKQEFYKAGCNYSVSASNEQVSINLSGLGENMNRGMELLEELLADAKPNQEALNNMVNDILKERENLKLSKDAILKQAMRNYGVYGPKSPYTNILTSDELKQIKAEELIGLMKELNSYSHHVLYYGSKLEEELNNNLGKYHKVPATFKPIPEATAFVELDIPQNKVYFVDYDMKQVEIMMLSKSVKYSKENIPVVTLFNEYFGGSMNSVVFQELRESKALAYTANSLYTIPDRKEKCHYQRSYIGTQVDKLPEAMKGLTELLNNMPLSDKNLSSSKEAIINKIRTERITKASILFNYEAAKKLGVDYDIRKDVFTKVQTMTMDDLKGFQEREIKNSNTIILVLGNKNKLDFSTLSKYGTITTLTLEQIFGY